MATSQPISRQKASWINGRNCSFIALIAVSLLGFWRPFGALFELAWQQDEYTHILLVLPVSLMLIFLESKGRSVRPAYAPGTALALLAVAAVIYWAGVHGAFGGNAGLSVAIFVLVTCWLAFVVGCYGFKVFRSLLFPFLFLFLLTPIPVPVLDRVISFLQSASTDATFALFKLTGVPVLKTGFLLSMPTLQIEVAKECSGIRSSMMLLITGLLLAHLFLRTFWSKLVFVLCIVPLAVAKNAVRIYTLSMLGMHVSIGFLEGRLHHNGGVVFFLLALVALLGLLWILQKAEGAKTRGKGSTRSVPRPAETS